MAERRSFQDKQYAFAAHIRDPEHWPAPPGIEDRRMAIYRQLFFSNLKNLLGTFFPVLKKLYSDQHWSRLIRRFMQQHQARTPYFLELPQEFLDFLQNEYEAEDDDYPFLAELAHYEYAELALSVSTASNDMTGVDPDGDLLGDVPAKSELVRVFAYRYPVHRITTTYLPTEPAEQPVYLALYRDGADSVGFLALNPVTAALLEAIGDNREARCGRELLAAIAADVGYADVDAFIGHGLEAMREMRDLGILTGTRKQR